MTDLLKWVIYAVYAAQGGKPKEPLPTPRPGVATRSKKRVGAAQLAYLQRLREEHARLHGYEPDGNVLPMLPTTAPAGGDAEAG